MPKIVDWDQRRDEILSATWRVIARDGITGATIRAIAKEANCSRGILGHYFDDKADILGLGASALAPPRRRPDGAPASAGLTGLDALRHVMLEALPLDERRDLEAQIEISFWGRALGNAPLRDLQHSEFDRLCARLRGHLARGRRAGRARAATATSTLRRISFVVLIDGLSAQRVLYPDRVTPQRQVEMLDRLLGSFRSPSAAGARGSRRRRLPTRVSLSTWRASRRSLHVLRRHRGRLRPAATWPGAAAVDWLLPTAATLSSISAPAPDC